MRARMCYEVPGAARAGTGIPHHGSLSGQEDLSHRPGLIRRSRWRQIPPAPVQAGLCRGLRSNHLLWRCIGGVDLQITLKPSTAETSELH